MTKRIVVFIYGVASYAIFFATFLYACAFVGGFAVPIRLDDPRSGPLGPALAINASLLALFAVQHSVMARKWFKDAWTRVIPAPAERSTYVLFSSAAMILLFWAWQPMGGRVWTVENPVGRALLYVGFAGGWLLVLWCTFLIDHFDLFGLRQVWFYLVGKPYTLPRFVTPAPYKLVRHPLYVGWLISFWVTPNMTVAHLFFAILTSAYIVIAIQFEEHDLVREHGESYRDYRRRVPMLLPFGRRRLEPVGPQDAAPARG